MSKYIPTKPANNPQKIPGDDPIIYTMYLRIDDYR